MKRHATLTIITIILSLLLSACGATQEVTPEPPPEVETVEQVTAEPKVAAVDIEATQTAAAQEQVATREAEATQQAEAAAMGAATAQAENEAATAEAERLAELLHPDLEVVAECGDPLGCVTIAPDQPIHLAAALAIGRPFGLDEQYGIEVALKEQAELLGHPFDLRIKDSGCSAGGGQTAATEIATDDSLVAVIGHSCGSSCVPAAQVYNDASLAMISPSCTPARLTSPEQFGSEVFLRTIPNDALQAQQMAEFAYEELGLRTAGTVHDGSPYSVGLTEEFAEMFVELGGEIVFQDAVLPGSSGTVRLNADLIYAPVFAAEGAAIANNVSGANVVLAGADGLMIPEFIEAAGQAAEGVYITAPAPELDDEQYEQFKAAYQEISGETEPVGDFHPYAYDATILLFDAIKRAAWQDEEGNLLIGRQALLDALHASQDVKGLTGTLTCTETGDCAAPGLVKVHQVQNGEFVPIYPSNQKSDQQSQGNDTQLGESIQSGESTETAAPKSNNLEAGNANQHLFEIPVPEDASFLTYSEEVAFWDGIHRNTYRTEYLIDSGQQDVVAFYRSQLEEKGWQLVDDNPNALRFTQEIDLMEGVPETAEAQIDLAAQDQGTYAIVKIITSEEDCDLLQLPDLPIIDDAAIKCATSQEVTYLTSKSDNQTLDFYKTELAAQGWNYNGSGRLGDEIFQRDGGTTEQGKITEVIRLDITEWNSGTVKVAVEKSENLQLLITPPSDK